MFSAGIFVGPGNPYFGSHLVFFELSFIKETQNLKHLCIYTHNLNQRSRTFRHFFPVFHITLNIICLTYLLVNSLIPNYCDFKLHCPKIWDVYISLSAIKKKYYFCNVTEDTFSFSATNHNISSCIFLCCLHGKR